MHFYVNFCIIDLQMLHELVVIGLFVDVEEIASCA